MAAGRRVSDRDQNHDAGTCKRCATLPIYHHRSHSFVSSRSLCVTSTMAKDRELSPKEEPEDDYGEDELEEEDDEGDFHIPDRLEPPETYDCTTEQLHKEIHHGIIDLYPPYQRGEQLVF